MTVEEVIIDLQGRISTLRAEQEPFRVEMAELMKGRVRRPNYDTPKGRQYDRLEREIGRRSRSIKEYETTLDTLRRYYMPDAYLAYLEARLREAKAALEAAVNDFRKVSLMYDVQSAEARIKAYLAIMLRYGSGPIPHDAFLTSE